MGREVRLGRSAVRRGSGATLRGLGSGPLCAGGGEPRDAPERRVRGGGSASGGQLRRRLGTSTATQAAETQEARQAGREVWGRESAWEVAPQEQPWCRGVRGGTRHTRPGARTKNQGGPEAPCFSLVGTWVQLESLGLGTAARPRNASASRSPRPGGWAGRGT